LPDSGDADGNVTSVSIANRIMTAEVTDSSSAPVATPESKPALAGSALPVALGIGAFVIVADQVTKQIAVDNITKGSPIGVFWKLQWNLHFNTGSAFSLGPDLGQFIGVLAVIVSVALMWYARSVVGRIPGALLGLVAGGAVGNVIDRLFRGEGGDGFMRGAVVDFIDFQFWPIFNVADMAIVVGAILLGIHLLLQGEPDVNSEPDIETRVEGVTTDD